MAYNTKKMVEDSNGDLIPQYFNQSADRYEHLRGAGGVSFTGNHVMTEGGIWVPQKGTNDGAAHTQVTGSNVEETVFERFLYYGQLSANDRDAAIKVPKFAKGFVAYMIIHGATGDYSEGGIRLKVHQAVHESYIGRSPFYEMETTIDRGSLVLYSYPGINRGDIDLMNTTQENVEIIASSLPIFNYLYFRLYMDGSPDEGEGFDIEMKITWLA